jgi:hypothetical protein
MEDKNQSKRLVSCAIASHAFRSQKNETLPMSHEVEEQVRKTYLEIINNVNWKEELIDIGKMIKQEYLIQAGLEDIQQENVNVNIISGDGVSHVITKDIITIGRAIGCDIKTTETFSDVSRLHAIMFVINNMILLVDIGSYFGMEMISRENMDKQLISSKPKNRCVILFDINEKVTVRFGSLYTLSFSPKQCVICLSNARSVILRPCNHVVLCLECYNILMQGDRCCPLCRFPIIGNNMCYRTDTYVYEKK